MSCGLRHGVRFRVPRAAVRGAGRWWWRARGCSCPASCAGGAPADARGAAAHAGSAAAGPGRTSPDAGSPATGAKLPTAERGSGAASQHRPTGAAQCGSRAAARSPRRRDASRSGGHAAGWRWCRAGCGQPPRRRLRNAAVAYARTRSGRCGRSHHAAGGSAAGTRRRQSAFVSPGGSSRPEPAGARAGQSRRRQSSRRWWRPAWTRWKPAGARRQSADDLAGHTRAR